MTTIIKFIILSLLPPPFFFEVGGGGKRKEGACLVSYLEIYKSCVIVKGLVTNDQWKSFYSEYCRLMYQLLLPWLSRMQKHLGTLVSVVRTIFDFGFTDLYDCHQMVTVLENVHRQTDRQTHILCLSLTQTDRQTHTFSLCLCLSVSLFLSLMYLYTRSLDGFLLVQYHLYRAKWC